MKTISASEANRQFSRILHEVEHGQVITVTSRGRPVASITPVQRGHQGREVARQRLLERLQQEAIAGERNWSRDELYE